MVKMSGKEVCRRLTVAGRLKMKPLCIYGSGEAMPGWIPAGNVDRCLFRVLLEISKEGKKTVYVGKEVLGNCCPGGAVHLGYSEPPEGLKYFISTGISTFRNGAAEYLKRSPQLVEESWRNMGRIEPLDRYTVIGPCDEVDESAGLAAVVCFGEAEQIRNICALNYFSTGRVFDAVLMPWGPACSTLITYPAGLAAGAPRDALFVGPVDPTVNRYFPPGFLAVSMSLETARRICDPIDESFLVKRLEVAYPDKREIG